MAGFDLVFAAMPLMCFLSGCLQNRASTWEMAAGVDVLFAVMPLMCFLSGCLQNRVSALGMAGFDLLFAAMLLRSEVFLERLFVKSSVYMGNGWSRVSMGCDATDVRLGASAGEIERLHGEWLVWMCCDATDVRLERLPAEWSVHMGNGWF